MKGTNPKTVKATSYELKEATYELGVGVDPADCHEAFSDLALEELNLVVHGAHVLLAGLGGDDQRRDHKLAVALFAS